MKKLILIFLAGALTGWLITRRLSRRQEYEDLAGETRPILP